MITEIVKSGNRWKIYRKGELIGDASSIETALILNTNGERHIVVGRHRFASISNG